jgi:uncharacterized membrane protein
MTLLSAFLIGIVAGLRSFTAPALVSWGALAGWVHVHGTWASWLGNPITVGVLTVLAVVEFITDQLPATPSRRTPVQFGARIITGGFSGAVLGACSLGLTVWGAVLGIVGAIVGTLGGYEARTRLVAATGGRDLPIALLGDVVAVLGALAIVRFL